MTMLIPWRRNTRRSMTRRRDEPINRLRNEFDALIERFLSGNDFGLEAIDDLDIDERENEFIVRAEIPGFEPEEVQVEFSDQVLTVKAEQKRERQKTGNGNTEEEFYRSYYRSVTLPAGIKSDQIKAQYHNGVLEVHVPRTEEAKPKRITVESSPASAREGQTEATPGGKQKAK